MNLTLRDAVPRRTTVLVLALTLGLATSTSAGAGPDPSPTGPSVPVSTVPVVGIGDAVCVQRGPHGPEPCQPE